jgi:hypothetical protein
LLLTRIMNATVIPRTTSRKTRRWEGFVTVPCEELSAIGKSFPFPLLENNTNLFTCDNQPMPRRQATATASCWCRTQLLAAGMVVLRRAKFVGDSPTRVSGRCLIQYSAFEQPKY